MSPETSSPLSSSLIDRVAIITGAAGSIGFGCAAALHAQGASVVLADLNGDRAAAVAARLGDRALGVAHDVTDLSSSEQLVAEALRVYGHLDIVVNNAGVGPRPAPLQDLALEEFDRVMNVNTRGVFITTKAAAPALVASGEGARIINISSVMGQSGDVEVCQYVASKHAVIGLTRAWALEFAKYGITANAICPGSVMTEMHDKVIAGYAVALSISEEESKDAFLKHIPMGRFQTSDDIGAVVAFLASGAARNITGTQLGVDGGWVLH